MYKTLITYTGVPGQLCPKNLKKRHLFIVVLLLLLTHISTAGFSQRITLNKKNASLDQVLKEIRNQSGFDIYYDSKVISKDKTVSVSFSNVDIHEALKRTFHGLDLTYEIQDKNITIKRVKPLPVNKVNQKLQDFVVRGKVLDESDQPLVGATVILKGTGRETKTNAQGLFSIDQVQEKSSLIITFVGYVTKEIQVDATADQMEIKLEASIERLRDVAINAGYYTVKPTEQTGNISRITAKDIENQPVTNVLSALNGRAPGVYVQTSNGLPGGQTTIQIRGKGSILAGTEPLYVIDGVPFDPVNASASGRMSSGSITGLISPLNTLNPADIESISILKDADATSIYGSRGSNGVVLISTKKGKPFEQQLTVSLQRGINKAASLPKILNLEQYLQIRREAYKNDGVEPSADPTSFSYAPELFAWDTTKTTNWGEYLLGHAADVTDLQLGLSGGNLKTTFNISGNYRSEGTIISENSQYKRGGLHANLQHTSADNKFMLMLSNTLSIDNSYMPNPQGGLSSALLLPPHFPLYDKIGNYNWTLYNNPLAAQQAIQKSNSVNLITNLMLRYQIINGLNVKVSGGYNRVSMDQVQIFPTASQYPGFANYSRFGNNHSQVFIVEPQMDYTNNIGQGKLSALLGATYQSREQKADEISVQNFSNQQLMESVGAAGNVEYLSNAQTNYKQVSVFARLNYIYQDKYIINTTIRRDGSSRFGPGNLFGTFGSIGLAWIFSGEKFISESLPWISQGKLRASFGWTGNDQIPDYAYLSTYTPSGMTYDGASTLVPYRVSNENYHWETTKKFEVAAELNFLNDRIKLNTSHYLNRSSDQLVNYTIPLMTGFSSYLANFPAVVQNSGWEFELSTDNIQRRNFTWSTTFNVTLPKNVLKRFDNIESSSYSQTLVVGEDITRVSGRIMSGIDPATGNPIYASRPGESTPYDFFTVGKTTPKYYGGLGNQLTYKRWSLEIFMQFAKQLQFGGLTSFPGGIYNDYAISANRWQKQGDVTNVPRASLFGDFFYAYSSAGSYEVPYLRVKNIALSFDVPTPKSFAAKGKHLKIYLQAQNLLTFWDNDLPLLDPETGGRGVFSNSMPPVKTIIAGLKLNL